MLWNILTYIYGCRFGIAVFERIEDEAFNPNVALEVGYMMGLGKPVCYLKERTLRTLHTDLVGQLYSEFDVENCEGNRVPHAAEMDGRQGLDNAASGEKGCCGSRRMIRR